MSKHTAGPIAAARAAWVRIGRQKPDGDMEIFRKADAEMRLIDSAPELLEALSVLQVEATHYQATGGGGTHLSKAIAQARAAIAKATGSAS